MECLRRAQSEKRLRLQFDDQTEVRDEMHLWGLDLIDKQSTGCPTLGGVSVDELRVYDFEHPPSYWRLMLESTAPAFAAVAAIAVACATGFWMIGWAASGFLRD